MASLAQLQQRFAERLADGPDAGDGGIAVYRRTSRANYRNALRASYPVVLALVEDASFDTLVDAYIALHPSTSGDLNLYGARFGDFLAGAPAARDLPYIADVARLEWTLDEAARAADASMAPADVFDALRRVPPDALVRAVLPLQPDRRLFRSAYPVMRIWQGRQPGAQARNDRALHGGDDLLLISRRPEGVQIERLTAAQHAWLSALAAEASLGAALDRALAIDPAFDVAAAVGARIADGTLGAPVIALTVRGGCRD